MSRRRRQAPARWLCSGPGRLAQALGIDVRHNGLDLLNGPLHLQRPATVAGKIRIGTRIGITRDTHRRLRFALADSGYVSRPI